MLLSYFFYTLLVVLSDSYYDLKWLITADFWFANIFFPLFQQDEVKISTFSKLINVLSQDASTGATLENGRLIAVIHVMIQNGNMDKIWFSPTKSKNGRWSSFLKYIQGSGGHHVHHLFYDGITEAADLQLIYIMFYR